MEKYTLQQRFVIIRKFYKNNRSFVETQRDLREDYEPNNPPSVLDIRLIVEKLETDFTLHDTKTPVLQGNATNQENINIARVRATENTNRSINRRSQKRNLLPKPAPTLRDNKGGRNTRSRKKNLKNSNPLIKTEKQDPIESKNSIPLIKTESQEHTKSNNSIMPEIKIEVFDREYVVPDIRFDYSSKVQIKQEVDSDSPHNKRK